MVRELISCFFCRFNDIFEQKAKQDEVFEAVARDVIDKYGCDED